MTPKELVEQVEKRFEMVLTMSALFPVVLATYFIITSATADIHSQNIAFGFFGLVAIYLASYVIFQLIKLLPIPQWVLVVLAWGLLASIACFIMPILSAVIVAA